MAIQERDIAVSNTNDLTAVLKKPKMIYRLHNRKVRFIAMFYGNVAV
jgi:hypothetical protein